MTNYSDHIVAFTFVARAPYDSAFDLYIDVSCPWSYRSVKFSYLRARKSLSAFGIDKPLLMPFESYDIHT